MILLKRKFLLLSFAAIALVTIQVSCIAADTTICQTSAKFLEKKYSIPAGLLEAISLAETGRWSRTQNRSQPWPWTVMARGKGTYHKSKKAAVLHVRKLQDQGVYNIDVGCMQVNLHYHAKHFSSISDSLEPMKNIEYGAQFLLQE